METTPSAQLNDRSSQADEGSGALGARVAAREESFVQGVAEVRRKFRFTK